MSGNFARLDQADLEAANAAFAAGIPGGLEGLQTSVSAAAAADPSNPYLGSQARNLRMKLLQNQYARTTAQDIANQEQASKIALKAAPGPVETREQWMKGALSKALSQGYNIPIDQLNIMADRIFGGGGQLQAGASTVPQAVPASVPQAGTTDAIQVIPGSPAWQRKETLRLQTEAGELAKEKSSPEYIERVERARATVQRDMANEQAMPSRRIAIEMSLETLPLLKSTASKIKALAVGRTTSGTIGQIMVNFEGSEQAELERLLTVIKSEVGLTNLIETKKAGATFGALQKSEMDLLIAKVGTLHGLGKVDNLSDTIDTVIRLYKSQIVRAKRDFKEMYPNVTRPWETVSDDDGYTVRRID
jgi:hypothetical protein